MLTGNEFQTLGADNRKARDSNIKCSAFMTLRISDGFILAIVYEKFKKNSKKDPDFGHVILKHSVWVKHNL